MAVSKRLRYEVLRRDNHTCRYCGRAAPDVPLTVDHVIPTALGGDDKPTNLVAACGDCNSGKSASSPDSPIVEDVWADALRWASALKFAADTQVADLEHRRAAEERFDEAWGTWKFGTDGEYEVPRDPDWRNTLAKFEAAGLREALIHEAIDIAMNNTRIHVDKVWRYFCGICWRYIDDLREAAAARVAADEGDI